MRFAPQGSNVTPGRGILREKNVCETWQLYEDEYLVYIIVILLEVWLD